MKVNAKKLTASQKKTIDALENVVSVSDEEHTKRVRVFMCGDINQFTTFRYSIYVGKRGRIYEYATGEL